MNQERYCKAIIRFIQMARRDHGGSRVAAQVLLSAYNGFDFQLDVADLGSLDTKNFEDAMTIIRGRYELGIEPHLMVNDGSRIFSGFWESWKHLHVKERGKSVCPRCDGRGGTYQDDRDRNKVMCNYCNGTGRVCGCKV